MKIIRGLNLTTSIKRALGVTKVKSKVAKKTGIPTTKQGMQRKIGATVINAIFGKSKK